MSQHFSGTHSSRFRTRPFVHARTSIPLVSSRDPFHAWQTRRAESERFHCVQLTCGNGQDDTGRPRYYARQRMMHPRKWMLEMCRGFLWRRRGAEQNTDRLWTVAIICITQRGPRTEHFCSYCPFVVLEFLFCHEMPLSVLTHIVQAYARVPQDPSLLTFPTSCR